MLPKKEQGFPRALIQHSQQQQLGHLRHSFSTRQSIIHIMTYAPLTDFQPPWHKDKRIGSFWVLLVWKHHTNTLEWIYCPTVKHRGRRDRKLKMFNLLHAVKVNLSATDGSLGKTKWLLAFWSLPRTLASITGQWYLPSVTPLWAHTYRNIYLVCLLPLRSCCATEAHLSASCVTSLRCRRRSLSGNFFISDSSIKALKLMRPFGKDAKLIKVSLSDGF